MLRHKSLRPCEVQSEVRFLARSPGKGFAMNVVFVSFFKSPWTHLLFHEVIMNVKTAAQ